MATVSTSDALLDHLAGDLVAQHETGRRGRAAAHHVLVRAADVGGDDLQDDAVIDVPAVGRLHPGIVDGLHFDLAGPEIDDAAIAGHGTLLPGSLPPGRRSRHSGYNACAPASATA